MQDGDGWYRRAVNEWLEPATQFFMRFMFNYVFIFICLLCIATTFLFYATSIVFFSVTRCKKKFPLLYVYDECYVCYCNGPALGGALHSS